MSQMHSKDGPGHIVAMGGGGFSVEQDNTLLDDFILSLSPRQSARVCFIPTASADSAPYLVKFYRSFSGRAIATDLTLFDPAAVPRRPSLTSELEAYIAEQDIFYVGGGNTAHLLALWRVHGLDRLLRDAWMRGATLCGVSAGMLCWFRGGLTDSFGGMEALHDGLGFLDATACPHYDGEALRRPTYQRLVEDGTLPWGYAADDRAAVHFHGTEFVEAISSHPDAGVYRVERVDGQMKETRLETRYLGA
jgi:peptidase E